MDNNINNTQSKGFLSHLPNLFSTLAGTVYGITEPKATRQIVTNWKGNGLANIEPYLLDERINRRGNPYDMSAMLSNMFGNSKGLLQGMFGNYKGLPSSISGIFKNKLGSIFRTPELEDQGSVRQAIDREVNNYPQWYQDAPISQAIREQNQYGKVDSVSPIYDALNTNYQLLDGTIFNKGNK